MASKWNNVETGILRKNEFKEKKEELFVFGYSCKLFRNDDRALHIDQGKHLIPWMGDETLKIDRCLRFSQRMYKVQKERLPAPRGTPAPPRLDTVTSSGDWIYLDRYDARGALHDLARFEAPPGGYDWRVELTRTEYEVEQMCDEERYRALHTDEDEELMYKEEELKRLHAAGYGQVGFNYDTPAEPKVEEQPVEVDEPFVPAPAFKALFQPDIMFPETQKQDAIIEKTAKFIATQGTQMEILIKAKQGDNPQFKFLNKDDVLHAYYIALAGLVKQGKWPQKEPEPVEEKPHEPDEYLHPSLASTIIEAAPSIPSIQYRPSADCDYSMLISKMRAEGESAPGELPPPGTEPAAMFAPHAALPYNAQVPPPLVPQLVPQPQLVYQQFPTYYPPPLVAPPPVAQPLGAPRAPTMKPISEPSTGLSLMQHYGSGTDTEPEDSEEESPDRSPEPPVAAPPEDVKLVIEKMSTYVARNGDEFADIVRAKNDPRFTFLDPADVYHPYYSRLMREKRGEVNGNGDKKAKAAVSFSIKKMKEPDPILPKPALPYESSSDEDPDKQTDKQNDKQPDTQPKPEEKQLQLMAQFTTNINTTPHAVIYKMDGQLTQNLPTIKTIEHMKPFIPKPVIPEVKEPPKLETAIIERINKDVEIKTAESTMKSKEFVKDKSVPKEPSPFVEKNTENKKDNSYENSRKDNKSEKDIVSSVKDDNSSYKRDKMRHKEQNYRSKSESREKRSRSRDREKRKEKDREKEKKRKKIAKDDLESEIISLEDNSDDMIDLTGDQSDTKGDADSEAEKAKQMERRRRAAEFLKKVGVDPGAAALPTNSLASAMVDTLESIRKKKAAEEEKRRKKEKRRRQKREYEDAEKSHRKSKKRKYKSSDENDESDYESTKKKKRKKDKKTSKKRKRRYEPAEEDSEEEQQLPANLDLSSTLKELRTKSPTKDLIIPDIEENIADETSSEEEEKEEFTKKKKKDREYSEGEWSSDSEVDSHSSAEGRGRGSARGRGSPPEE